MKKYEGNREIRFEEKQNTASKARRSHLEVDGNQ